MARIAVDLEILYGSYSAFVNIYGLKKRYSENSEPVHHTFWRSIRNFRYQPKFRISARSIQEIYPLLGTMYLHTNPH
jgi:hypothetical protein